MAAAQTQPIGKAFIIYGTVKAVAANGTERLLAPNSPIYAGERIVTGPDGSISIVFNDNSGHLDLGRMSDVLMDQDVYAGVGPDQAADAVAQAAEIQAALENGEIDPTTQLPPPAAGAGVAGPRGGGRQIVVFEADQMEVLPDSGAETTGVGLDFLDPPGGVVTEPEEVIIPDIPPAPTPAASATPTPDEEPPPVPPPDVVPLMTLAPIAGGVQEDALDNAFSVGILDTAADTDSITMDLLPLVSVDFGTDGPGTLVFSLVNPNGAAAGLTSKGVGVVYQQNGNAIEAYAGDRLVFTFTVQPSGAAEFTLYDQVDHPTATGDNALLTITNLGQYVQVTATDADGDAVTLPFTGLITVTVENDTPVLTLAQQAVSGAVQEDALGQTTGNAQNNPDGDFSQGNLDTAADTDTVILQLSDLVNVAPGADEPASISYGITQFTGGVDSGYDSKGQNVLYYNEGGTLVARAGSATGTVVFTFGVNSDTGAATFNLNDQLDHPTASGDNATLSITNLGQYVQVSVTDLDGDAKSTNLTGLITVTVENDVPAVTMAPPEASVTIAATVLEDGLSREDDPGDPDFSEGNRETAAPNTETVDADEASDLTGGNLTGLFTATYDPIGADEDGVPASPTITTGLSTDLSGLATLYSKGVQLIYTVTTDPVNADTLTATGENGNTVFTLVVNKDGSWSFDLDDQLDHVAGDGENTALRSVDPDENPISVNGIDFSSILVGTATGADFDGDEATATTTGVAPGSFVVTVVDDVPAVTMAPPEASVTIAATVLEDGLSREDDPGDPDFSEGNRETAAPNTETVDADEASDLTGGNLTGLFTATYDPIGADEDGVPASPTITTGLSTDLSGLATLYSKGVQLSYTVTTDPVNADTLTATGENGNTVFTLVVNKDGSWSFDLDDQLDHVAGDGENTALRSVDPDENPISVNGIDFSSILVGTATGADFDGDEATATTTGVAPGSFVVTVVDDVPAVTMAPPEASVTIAATVLEDGLSREGDPGDPDFSEGNRETAAPNTETVDSDEASDLTGGNLTGLFTATYDPIGADEDGVPASPTITTGLSTDLSGLATLYSKGVQLSYTVTTDPVNADTLTATGENGNTVFTLVVNKDGSWSFDLDDQLDHVAGDGENTALRSVDPDENPISVNGIDFSSILVGTATGADFDGDEATATTTGVAPGSFVVTVVDDVPAVTMAPPEESVTIAATVLEDGLSREDDPGDPDFSEGNRETAAPNTETVDSDEASDLTGGNLTGLFTATYDPIGADEDGVPASPTITTGLSTDLSGLATLYSKGVQLIYTVTTDPVNADTLTATGENGNTVFTLVVNKDGSWSFDLDDQLDHVAGDGENTALRSVDPDENPISVNGIDFSSILVGTATGADFDGDEATATTTGVAPGSFVVTVVDDVPAVTMAPPEASVTIAATVLEDGLSREDDPGDPDFSEGNRETAAPNTETVDADEASDLTGGNLTGLFTATYDPIGADEDGVPASPTITTGLSTDLSGLATLYSKGVQLSYTVTTDPVNADTLTATGENGNTVFTLVVNKDGSWSFDLDDQLDHVAGDGENTALRSVDPDENPISVNGIDFSSILVGTATGADFDGDQDTATTTGVDAGSFVVTVVDDVPPLPVKNEGVFGTVYEDALGQSSLNPPNNDDPDLSTGIPESPSMTDSVTFQLSRLVESATGADEPAAPVYSIVNPNNAPSGLSSKGQAVTYQVRTAEPNTLLAVTADGRTVFTFSVDENSGEVTFNLNDQLDHGGAGTDVETLPILNLGRYVQVSVTDADGDTVTQNFGGRIGINVENDVPTTAADDARLINTPGGSTMESFNNLPGADEEISLITFDVGEGAAVMSVDGSVDGPQMTSGGVGLVWHIDPSGNLQAVKDGDASLTPVFTVSADKAGDEYTGEYTVNITGPIDNGSQTVSYELTKVSSGNTPTIEIEGSSPQGTIFIYGKVVNPSGESVNVSDQGIGVHNNKIGGGEELSFEFYADEDRDTPLALTSLGFSVDFLADTEEMLVVLYSDGAQIGNPIVLTGATNANDSASSDSYLEVSAEDAGLTAGPTFDEVHFKYGPNTGDKLRDYRLLFTTLVVTTDPLDQQIVIPYTVTDADADTDSDAFSVTFLNAAQTTSTTMLSATAGDGDAAPAMMSMMSASAFVPGEQIEGDNADGEDWSADEAPPAEDSDGDGAGLVVTTGEDEADASETPDSADDIGSELLTGLSDAALGGSEGSDPAAPPVPDGTDGADQPSAGADNTAKTSDQPAVPDDTDQPADSAPDVVADADQPVESTEGTAGGADQPAAADAAVQAVAGVDAATGETGEVAGTTDTGLDSDVPPTEVAASEAPESETQDGLGESEAGATDLLTAEVTGSPEEVPGTDATDAADQPTETADSGEPEGAVTEDLTDALFPDAGGEEEVPTDSFDTEADTGGADSGLDMDTLIDPGSGQIG